jgi:Tfp pilus assembly major pilin PilA
MIAIGIIGLLATIALPIYQDNVNRAQLAEGLGLVGPAKIAVSEYVTVTNDWPKDNAAANPGIFDRQLELTGTYLGQGNIVWTCAAKTGKGKGKAEFNPSHLPVSCR